MLMCNRKSEFIGTKDILRAITEILQPKSQKGQPISDRATLDRLDDVEDRLVVLVGHDIEQDMEYLKKVGYNVYDNDQLLEVIDTRNMHQHHRRWLNPSALGNVLFDLGIEHKDLHNAGNDAVYTLQALVALAFRKRQQSLASKKSKEGKR